MKNKQATVTEETVRLIAARALEMPEKPSKRALSTRAAIDLLKKEMVMLQKRGYSLDEITEFLTGNGLPIASLTLRAYLQRHTAAPARRKKAAAADATATPAHTDAPTPQNPQKGLFVPRADSSDI